MTQLLFPRDTELIYINTAESTSIFLRCTECEEEEVVRSRYIMITKEEILNQVQKLLIEAFELDESTVSPEAHLYNDLDLDSFDAIDLAVKIGLETGIKLQEDDLSSIRTISDIVEVVYKKFHP